MFKGLKPLRFRVESAIPIPVLATPFLSKPPVAFTASLDRVPFLKRNSHPAKVGNGSPLLPAFPCPECNPGVFDHRWEIRRFSDTAKPLPLSADCFLVAKRSPAQMILHPGIHHPNPLTVSIRRGKESKHAPGGREPRRHSAKLFSISYLRLSHYASYAYFKNSATPHRTGQDS